MPRPPTIPLEWLEPLPVVYRTVIPPEYRDAMDHMNVRWYLALYDEAGDEMYKLYGQTAEYYRAHDAGGFDLEHHIRYLAEVRIGDTVAVRARLLRRTEKRLHYMMFMVNETRGVLSSTFECINSHADLKQRRTAPYPDFIAAQIDAIIAQHSQLEWDAPVCGAMGA
jgi:acyl-CoA thioester hydrolase